MAHAAIVQDAVAPHALQRIAERLAFAFHRRVAGVDDQRRLGGKQANGYVALVDTLDEAVGGVRREDAVDPALHDGRRRTPAVGMDDGQKIAVAQFVDVLADQRVGRRLTARLSGGQAGIEAFLDQIVKADLAARRQPPLPDVVRDGAAEASGSGMADDDQCLHEAPS